MTNKNKRRGKYFENVVATHLINTLGWSKNECFRSPNSGNGEFEYGDVFFDSTCEFKDMVLECKYHKSWEFPSFFPKLNKLYQSWIMELLQAVDKYTIFNKVGPRFFGVVFSKPYAEVYFLILSEHSLDYVETFESYMKIEDFIVKDSDGLIKVYKCRCVLFKEFVEYLKSLKEHSNG